MLPKKTLLALFCSCFVISMNSNATVYNDEYPDDSGEDFAYTSTDDRSSDPYYEEEDRYQPPQRSAKKSKRQQQAYDDGGGYYDGGYSSRLPQYYATHGEKVIVVDPKVHAWGAYDTSGQLLKAGLATAGGNWCADIKRPCRTRSGTFRINSLGAEDCVSTRYPLGKGGAPMPYCMYFNGSQGIHGSDNVVEGNVSHGCVRVTTDDAAWIRFNFSEIGTKVVVMGY